MGELKLWYARPRRGRRWRVVAVAAMVAAYAVVLMGLLFVEAMLFLLLRGLLEAGLAWPSVFGVALFGAAAVFVGWKMFRLVRELVRGLRDCNRQTPAGGLATAPPDERD